MDKEKVAIYPGSFDPFTLGHKVIVEQSLRLFDKIIIAIGDNIAKKPFISTERRIELIRKCFKDNNRIEIVVYKGLTAEYCRINDINIIIRGVRNTVDFEFERSTANVNQKLNNKLETIFLMTPVEYSEISSTIVREVFINGGNPSMFLPDEISVEDFK